MVRVTIEVREGAISRRAQITAPSIERALTMAGKRAPGRRVRLVSPVDPETFFVPAPSGTREAA